MQTSHPYPIGSICETYSQEEIEIIKHLDNPSYIQVINKQDLNKKKQTICFSTIKKLISVPLPLDYSNFNHQQQPDHKLTTRGGKRDGAGRKPTGQPPKKRKAIQLDESIAKNLPDLKQLLQLIQEYRPIAESGQLRSQKLADFYKKLDLLPTII